MKISLQTDNTLYLPIQAIAARLNELCAKARFLPGDQTVRINEPVITCPGSHKKLLAQHPMSTDIDAWVVFTSVPYDNNFFYEEYKNLVIVSVSN